MATLFEFEGEQLEAWNAWLAERPPVIREMAERLPPNKLYRLKSSDHRVTLHSYSENSTVTVNVTGEYNSVVFDRQVFGIKPEDLEECDLPSPDYICGTLLTEQEDVDDFIGSQVAELHERGERHNESRCPLCSTTQTRGSDNA